MDYLEIISNLIIKILGRQEACLGIRRIQVQYLVLQIVKLIRVHLCSVVNLKIINNLHQCLEIQIKGILQGPHKELVYLEMILYNQCLVLLVCNHRLKLGLLLE